MRDDFTLTERVQRLEKVAQNAGYNLGDFTVMQDNAEPDYLAPWKRTGQRHVNETLSDRAAGEYDKVQMHMERASKAPQQTGLQEISARVQTATERVYSIAMKIEEIGIRVMGPLPQDGEELGVSSRTADGTLDFTFTALNWLDQSLARLHHAVVRIENV